MKPEVTRKKQKLQDEARRKYKKKFKFMFTWRKMEFFSVEGTNMKPETQCFCVYEMPQGFGSGINLEFEIRTQAMKNCPIK